MSQCNRLFRSHIATAVVLFVLALLPTFAAAQSYDDLWDYCAKEGRDCQLNGPAQVRFGVDGAFVYRRVRGSFRCDVQTFGDPAPGRRKSCEVQRFDQGNYQSYQQEEQGFADCASENRICEARGPATIRYGARGQFVYLDVYNEAVPCDNQTFGDPAPGRKKRCEIRYEGASGYGQQGYPQQGYPQQAPHQPHYDDGYAQEWISCASENQICYVPGPALVRFGGNGSYTTRQVRGRSIHCDNTTFGDPAPRKRKSCDYQLLGSASGQGYGNQGYGAQGDEWIECAKENGFCRFSGRRLVRFGDGYGREVVLEFRNGVQCSIDAFRSDPAPRKRKYCAIQGGY
jgi:hypothetical protein